MVASNYVIILQLQKQNKQATLQFCTIHWAALVQGFYRGHWSSSLSKQKIDGALNQNFLFKKKKKKWLKTFGENSKNFKATAKLCHPQKRQSYQTGRGYTTSFWKERHNQPTCLYNQRDAGSPKPFNYMGKDASVLISPKGFSMGISLAKGTEAEANVFQPGKHSGSFKFS